MPTGVGTPHRVYERVSSLLMFRDPFATCGMIDAINSIIMIRRGTKKDSRPEPCARPRRRNHPAEMTRDGRNSGPMVLVWAASMLWSYRSRGSAFAGAVLLAGSGCVPQQAPPSRPGGADSPAPGPGMLKPEQFELLPSTGNLLENPAFTEGGLEPWVPTFAAGAVGKVNVRDGMLCARIEDSGPSGRAFSLRYPVIVRPQSSYELQFAVSSDVAAELKVAVSTADGAKSWGGTLLSYGSGEDLPQRSVRSGRERLVGDDRVRTQAKPPPARPIRCVWAR